MHYQHGHPHILKHLSQGPKTGKENLSALTTKVLCICLQVLSLCMTCAWLVHVLSDGDLVLDFHQGPFYLSAGSEPVHDLCMTCACAQWWWFSSWFSLVLSLRSTFLSTEFQNFTNEIRNVHVDVLKPLEDIINKVIINLSLIRWGWSASINKLGKKLAILNFSLRFYL